MNFNEVLRASVLREAGQQKYSYRLQVRPVKLERSNVEFPLWRKKVGKPMFEHNGTTSPVWACEMWELPRFFSNVSSN
jgi:hypothetical protein